MIRTASNKSVRILHRRDAESAENRRGNRSIVSALLRVLCGSALRTITYKNAMSLLGGGTGLMARRFRERFMVFLVLATALSSAVQPVHAQEKSSPGFAFIPFENKSDFKGKWDVGSDVPRFLSAYVKERYRIPTISPVIVRNFFNEQNHQGAEINDVGF